MQGICKVGIITLYNDNNYGNRLQCWALQHILEGLGAQPEELYLVTNKFDQKENKRKTNRPNVYKLRGGEFEQFTKQNSSFKKVCYAKKRELDALNDEYDLFIAGSDQIWNPHFITNFHAALLKFAKPEKKASYAASIGIQKLPLFFVGKLKKGWSDFRYLSLRENSGKEIVDKVLKKDVSLVHLDPTLLVSKQDWLNFCKEEQEERKPYILTYFLGKSDEFKKKVEDIAKDNQLEIINLNDISDEKTFIANPKKFVALFSGASLVCTDSFHGCVFSILFEKPFVLFQRNFYLDMNSRFATLFEKLEVEDRSYNKLNANQIFNLDYTEINKNLEKERNKSFAYLNMILNNKEGKK